MFIFSLHVNQLLDELGKELQELRNYKVESEERSRLHAPSPKDIPSLHKRELENHIVRLKEVSYFLSHHKKIEILFVLE